MGFPGFRNDFGFGFGEKTSTKKSQIRDPSNYRRNDNYCPEFPRFSNDFDFGFGEKKTTAKKYPIRDTCNYTLKDKNDEPVYYGITNDPKRRIEEHKRSGKKFANWEHSAKRSRESALKHEKEELMKYRSEKGKLPKYNKIL